MNVSCQLDNLGQIVYFHFLALGFQIPFWFLSED